MSFCEPETYTVAWIPWMEYEYWTNIKKIILIIEVTCCRSRLFLNGHCITIESCLVEKHTEIYFLILLQVAQSMKRLNKWEGKKPLLAGQEWNKDKNGSRSIFLKCVKCDVDRNSILKSRILYYWETFFFLDNSGSRPIIQLDSVVGSSGLQDQPNMPPSVCRFCPCSHSMMQRLIFVQYWKTMQSLTCPKID
jgi:hypothetical protein